MRLFPKVYYKWREPKAFLKMHRAFREKNRKWWAKPLTALGVIFALIAKTAIEVGKIPHNLSNESIWALIVLLLFTGVFMAYLMPWIYGLIPTEIAFKDKKITKVGGGDPVWKYTDILQFEWRFSDKFYTLVLIKRSGEIDFIGVPLGVDTDAVSDFLSTRIQEAQALK